MDIVVKINILWIATGLIVLPLLGFLFRKGLTAVEKNKVATLEKDMLENHAEILSLQEKIATLQQRIPESNDVPVVSLNDPATSKNYPKKDSGNSGASFKSFQ